jgi:hypothetical protein
VAFDPKRSFLSSCYLFPSFIQLFLNEYRSYRTFWVRYYITPSILALSLVHIVESDYSGMGWWESGMET